jgi:hypothetical protein
MHVSDLDSTVNRQACEWVGEVALRLNIVVEVTNGQGALLCPVGPSRDATIIRRLLTAGEPSFREAMADATRSRMPSPVTVEGLQILCFALVVGGNVLIARRPAADEASDDTRHDLESIGTWLVGAIDASLAQPNTIGVEPYRIVSFRRILREATARGSLRKVIGAFVEALSVWDDVRVSAYVAAASAGFFQYVSTMAALPTSLPHELDESFLPRGGRMFRLPRAEADRLGLASGPGDTLLMRVRIGTETEWLLVFSGMIDDRVEVRLRVYSDILRESLDDVLTTALSRIVAGVARRQLPAGQSIDVAVQTSIGQIAAAVGANQSALALTTPGGQQALAVGNTDLLSGLDRLRLNRLVVRVSDTGGLLTAAVEREQAPFTAFEREIVQAGVTAMYSWVQAAATRPSDAERRQAHRPIDVMFDELATEAVASGQPASVIVLAIATDTTGSGLLSAWVGKIRGQLRGGDRAAILSEREIAVLLCGASADQAATVSSRLRQIFDTDDTPHGYAHPTFGLMTRVPDSPFEGSLVGAARASVVALR